MRHAPPNPPQAPAAARPPRPVVHLAVRRRAGAQPAADPRPAGADRLARAGATSGSSELVELTLARRHAAPRRDPRARADPGRGAAAAREPLPAPRRQPRPRPALDFRLGRRRGRRRARRSRPTPSLLERLEWGNFYGRLVELRRGDEVARHAAPTRSGRRFAAAARAQAARARAPSATLERGAIGDVNYAIEELRLAERRLALARPRRRPSARAAQAEIDARARGARGASTSELAARLFADARARSPPRRWSSRRPTAQRKEIAGRRRSCAPCGPTRMGAVAKLALYARRACASSSPTTRASRTPRAASSRPSSAP